MSRCSVFFFLVLFSEGKTELTFDTDVDGFLKGEGRKGEREGERDLEEEREETKGVRRRKDSSRRRLC